MSRVLSHLFELVVLAFIAVVCLLGYGVPNLATHVRSFWLWFVIGIAAVVAMILLLLGVV